MLIVRFELAMLSWSPSDIVFDDDKDPYANMLPDDDASNIAIATMVP